MSLDAGLAILNPAMKKTLNHLFQEAVRTKARPDMFRRREDGAYHSVSSAEMDAAVREASQGLVDRGVAPGDRVALLSENRWGWAVADLAILGAGAVVVPIYPTLTPEQIAVQLTNCGAAAIFVSTHHQLAKLEAMRDQRPGPMLVITFDDLGHDDLVTLDQLRAEGRAKLADGQDGYTARIEAIQPDDVATILYTSGTTGEPKGVMLTHRNIVANVIAGVAVLGISHTDRCLSFLPLSHILERTGGHYAMIHGGVSIAYAESIDTLADNMAEIQPTAMISVPRLFEKIDAAMSAKAASSPISRKILGWSKSVARRYTRAKLSGKPVGPGLRLQHSFMDKLVYAKLRARTGGHIRFMVSGGAPLGQELAEFFYAAGLTLVEGYGLTETSPVIALNSLTALKPGTVGRPVPGAEVKIAEDGEILCRSESIMKGYYQNPVATAEVIKDGWFHTGDIGHLDEDGFLVITDRKKDLIVTSGGKNIAPQPIESALKLDGLVDQVAVIGDRRKFLVALISPNLANVVAWAQLNGVPTEPTAAMLSHPALVEYMQKRVDELNVARPSFEQIKRFAILDRELSQENGDLTPTLKVKRRVVEKKYADVIERLYAGA